jgi:hypothetical protein
MSKQTPPTTIQSTTRVRKNTRGAGASGTSGGRLFGMVASRRFCLFRRGRMSSATPWIRRATQKTTGATTVTNTPHDDRHGTAATFDDEKRSRHTTMID